ncbi:MAG: T9SS type A sorting domain-containing protein [Bacteroidota bacterium]|nr:T9SS type A sorting domain-containing protein [Bacteroidota bacterium]
MKRIFTQVFLVAMLALSVSAVAQDSLFISELSDPADDYSGRFIELYNAGSESVDFSTFTCYLSRQSNGGTTWGDLQLTGVVAAGGTFVIGGSGFEALYGFAPDQETGILIGNGDDAYFLFRDGDHTSGVLHDIFGVIDMDGTGEPWEYLDSRASRLENVLIPNTTWTAFEWEIVSANVADCDPGTHLGSTPVIPTGDFALVLQNDTANWGELVEVPVLVSQLNAGDQVISYQFDLDFDSLVLEYAGMSLAGTIAEGGTVLVNDQVAGELSVGYMHSTAITGAGEILVLQFNALSLDTTSLIISNAYLNNTPLTDLTSCTVIITETAPPTAVITYSDTTLRFADTLEITASFSEAMDPAFPVLLSLEGAVSMTDAEMTRLGETTYSYFFPVPRTGGEVSVSLGNGRDLWGNPVVSLPTEGGTFTIIPFHPGDVDDDGVILAYDAALTLQYSVGMDPLPLVDPLPWERWRDSTANVDGTGGITAHDAGMILQYSAGIISDFSGASLKSASGTNVTLELVDQHLVFYSHGELIGFNLNTINNEGILGIPVILKEEFMSAVNMTGNTYRVGLCTAHPAPDGEAVMKIPFYGSGQVRLHMVVNTMERVLQLDLVTGLIEMESQSIDIYPNPVADRLKVRGLSASSFVRISNIHGNLLLSTRMETESGEIDLSALAAGLYLITIQTEGETISRSFIKK